MSNKDSNKLTAEGPRRDMFAAAALTGLMSNNEVEYNPAAYAEIIRQIVDAVLEALDKEEPK